MSLPELIIVFFKEFVFKRTYTNYVPIGSDVRTQIYLRTDNEPSLSTTLPQYEKNKLFIYIHSTVILIHSFPFILFRIVTEAASLSRDEKSKILEVPLSYESVNQYKKPLMFLHEFQRKQRSTVWPSPKGTRDLMDTIKEYERSLVYDQVQTNADRAAHYVIRDSYKSGQLIKIVKSRWVSNNKSGLREIFSISARHHMLLRDQDLRNLNFAGCFCTIIPKKQHRRTQHVVGLVFCLDKGKTLKEGEVKFACAIRHENVFRCPVGGFAFLMFSLLQVYLYINRNLI